MSESLVHEIAVLRPKPGDVVVLYVDLFQVVDAELLGRQMGDLRRAGVHVLLVPTTACVSCHEHAPAAEMRGACDEWLVPLGFHAVPLDIVAGR